MPFVRSSRPRRHLAIASAILLLTAACDRASDDGQAFTRAQTLMARADYPAARVELMNAARQRPMDPAVQIAIAQTLLELGDGQGANGALDSAARLGATAVMTDILRADAANMMGSPDTAIAIAARIAADQPADAARLRGGAYLVQGNGPAAIAAFREGLALRPGDARLNIEMGHAMLAAGDLIAAANHAAQATRSDPRRIGAPLLAGRAAEALGNSRAALAAYDRAIALRPDSFAAHAGRAAMLGDLGRVPAMRAALDDADRVSPDHPRTLFLRAKLAANLGNLDDAQQLLTRGGAALERDLAAVVLSAQIAQRQGFESLAIARMRSATRIAPDQLHLSYLLADMLWRDGQADAALAALRVFDTLPAEPVEVATLRRAMAAGAPPAATRT